MISTVLLPDVSPDDKSQLDHDVALMTGERALERLPILQPRRDRRAGLRSAGFVSGSRGSPAFITLQYLLEW
jgi:indolepyruvate ferredoxin oxidoreductase